MEDRETSDGPGGPQDLISASFNQDTTSLSVGTKSGYRLFSVTSVDKMDCIHEGGDLSMPRRMNVYHFKRGTEICNYSYSNNILSVRLNRQRLVVCLEESVYIHNIKDMKLLKTLLNTPHNPSGLCALSVNHGNSYLAYPGSQTIGEIIVYNANNLSTVTMIPAHDSPLAALTFNASGTKLASASERGTVIRVFTIPEGQRLFEFRRGMKRYVSISSLSFSTDGQFLCASSNTETVHIFKLEHHSPSREEESPTWGVYVGKMFTAASTYLPSQVSDMMHQDRAFATVRLNMFGLKNVCALATLFEGDEEPQEEQQEEEELEDGRSLPPSTSPSNAATVALPSTPPSSTTLSGYSEDGGAEKGDVIPEHEFTEGPVCLDDENEFPPVSNQSN
ncbi:unnamed protein product [Coregonus sp. 'balchen']|nr:unnamed protein product [Coregonus sp. 'balchen']